MGILPNNAVVGGKMFYKGKVLDTAKMKELRGDKIAFIPQSVECLDPLMQVGAQVAGKTRDYGKMRAAFTHYELPKQTEKMYPFQLSGGMAQRVTIALAACSQAKLIIADEPSNGLDEDFAEDFLTLVRSVFPDAAILMITHDISMASGCENIAVLCGGKIMEKGPAQEVLARPKSPYTKALIAALPAKGMKQTPVLRQGSSDCPFYERCPGAGFYCREALVWRGTDEQGWRCCAR
jgi:peptide/nickel transport system ATP-binding protein